MRWLALIGLLWAVPAVAQNGAMSALRPGSAISVMGQGRGAMSGAAVTGTAPPASYVGPGDLVSGATAWYGLRAYKASYATGSNPAITIRRASDSTTATINILATGNLDVATATAFCASTTCFVTQAFDQTGNGNNATQATAANQPQLSFSCAGSLPCMAFNGAQGLSAASFTLAQPTSMSAVAMRSSSNTTTEQYIIGEPGTPYSQLSFENIANTAYIYSYNSKLTVSAADGVTHALQGVLVAGASQSINIDGTLTTGSGGAGTPMSGLLTIGGGTAAPLYGNIEEAGIWPSAFTPTQQTAVCHNQSAAYSLGLSC